MGLAALLATALQAAAQPPCTAEDVRTASVPPQIAWTAATFQRDIPAEQRRWFTVALGEGTTFDSPDFGFLALPMSPYEYAFFATAGDRMKLFLCRGATCQTGYDGRKREVAWASTFTEGMPDLVFDRTEVNVFDRGRYRRVCRVTFETP
jgi:hypothetical protein